MARSYVIRVDVELYKELEKIRKEFEKNGLRISFTQASKIFVKKLKRPKLENLDLF